MASAHAPKLATPWCLLAAIAAHAACAAALPGGPANHVAPPMVAEVEFAAIREPQPIAPPPPADAPPPPAPASAPKPKRAARPRAPAPAPAPPLLTALETPSAPAAEPPVRFASDPHGRGYGYGVVARAGATDGGAAGVPGAGSARTTSAGEAITPASELQREPVLLADDGCDGYFPDHASHDRGSVAVIATVRASGAAARLEVESETPAGEGFAAAALACLRAQRFAPALDRSGRPTAARTRIHVRFSR